MLPHILQRSLTVFQELTSIISLYSSKSIYIENFKPYKFYKNEKRKKKESHKPGLCFACRQRHYAAKCLAKAPKNMKTVALSKISKAMLRITKAIPHYKQPLILYYYFAMLKAHSRKLTPVWIVVKQVHLTHLHINEGSCVQIT